MRSRDFALSSSPAELFAAHAKPTDAAGETEGRHAEADPPKLHRHARFRPGAHGPVLYARPLVLERLPRQLGERDRSSETHRRSRGRWAAGGRAPQTGPDHLHSHVPTSLPAGASHCVLH